ncbi:MAG: RnfABCDGE type electron transport complex subunit A [Candidatus Omnitrophota bacterium]
MDFSGLLMIAISAVFVNNFILTKFLGLCPFIGVSRSTKPALSMGLAVTFVMTMASIITWAIYRYILLPYNLEYLRTVAFILVIASFVQFVEIILRKFAPAIYKAFGIYLALITTNCAVFGVAVLNIDQFFFEGKAVQTSFLKASLQGFSAGIGFLIAIFLMSGIRERLDFSDVPAPLRGIAITFIVASLMSMAFLGFSGFKL